ncbi:putative transcription factor B3-Domain family [Helianthus annuus]|uniref:Putative DNA-binding pseudobarrel domain-containing protein n=1 Tax=Helianthus annuus TaxID=4232 RepID=A0A251TVA5_HELAN|nr:putative transcription factor B3-Domain family [Helianthus annuus]KAJ0526012.1 putative transcription factor B3-Domain family [Helianthus annuus]KAJ0534302.1 putative transcription factor B3-Domain family [Helianthus annuus]KAJ0542406.1 putative transcription factor B3-Domain family [Helianthus annuus]KAJ0707447.1 putative transcription factor B3-Domain family [Helianthus annuus]
MVQELKLKKDDILRLQKKLAQVVNLRSNTILTIKDPEGVEFRMGLKKEMSHGRPKYAVEDWPFISNGIEDGDICTFTYSKSEGILFLNEAVKNINPVG